AARPARPRRGEGAKGLVDPAVAVHTLDHTAAYDLQAVDDLRVVPPGGPERLARPVETQSVVRQGRRCDEKEKDDEPASHALVTQRNARMSRGTPALLAHHTPIPLPGGLRSQFGAIPASIWSCASGAGNCAVAMGSEKW